MPVLSAAARTRASTAVSGTLMTRKIRVLRKDPRTRGSVSTVTKLSKPTNGRSTSVPGAVKK